MSQSEGSDVSILETASEPASEHRAAQLEASARLIPVWAIGETRAMSERERRLTAAVYAQTPGVLDHVLCEGRLPRKLAGSGREMRLRTLVQRRGVDLELSAAERAVYRAILAEGDVPEEWAVLIDSRGRTRPV